jgi:hypothetical protein
MVLGLMPACKQDQVQNHGSNTGAGQHQSCRRGVCIRNLIHQHYGKQRKTNRLKISTIPFLHCQAITLINRIMPVPGGPFDNRADALQYGGINLVE